MLIRMQGLSQIPSNRRNEIITFVVSKLTCKKWGVEIRRFEKFAEILALKNEIRNRSYASILCA